ncbi:MAG TPA: hypothetical protein VFL86_18610, partial [Burkholderiaceae bacterium]|nr:hypothetical protein [Burkholderiaceae bacterium]
HHSNAPQQAGSSAPSKPWQESVRADNAGHGSGSASGRIPPPDVLQLDVSFSHRFFRYSSPYSAIGGPLQGMRSWQVRAVKAEHNISHMTDQEAAMYLTLQKEANFQATGKLPSLEKGLLESDYSPSPELLSKLAKLDG